MGTTAMAETPVLYGFSGSTYVRTVRIVLAEKGIEYQQVPVNVMAGEQKGAEHLQRHPFGKVPVMDIDGMRLRETEAICRYLDETRPQNTVVPETPRDRARMTEVVGLINSYGYTPLIQAALHHLMPGAMGSADEAAQEDRLHRGEMLLGLLMDVKGDSPWLAGERPSLADYFLAPLAHYIGLTPAAERLFATEGLAAWWRATSALPAVKATEPSF